MTEKGNRVAAITGSARNIGRATALALARDGVSVLVHARQDREGVDETVALIEGTGGAAHGHLADITEEDGAASVIGSALERFGRVDILINNAAIRRNTPITKLSLGEWREVMAVCLEGAFLCSRAAVPHMRAQGSGQIVNIGGLAGHRGMTGRVHVAAAKSGLVGFTKALATELADDGITATCVVPGLIETERGAAAGGPPSHPLGTGTLIGREGHPEEIAAVVAMLCRPEAAFATGQTFHVNGGAYLA
ncbi:MAG: SDR family NAD(P)-dependent oxidoreductase [Methyloligellaceae bacterium]